MMESVDISIEEDICMYSISEASKVTGLTARALRYYEEKGLVRVLYRGGSGYRYYNEETITRLKQIKKLKKMNFSLSEIKEYLELQGENSEEALINSLSRKLKSVELEMNRLIETKQNIETQLLTTKDFFKGKILKKGQRRVLMETIKSEILNKLKGRREVTHKDLEYLKREDYLYDTEDKREFIKVVKDCLEFARNEGIRLGPARGASPALLSLYALGWSEFDPSEYNLVPERFSISNFDLHIDVEFKNGKKFIDYCRAATKNLKIGKIEAFKLPILDIINNVHERLGFEIDYDSVDNNDPLILDLFRAGDIERIFSFDLPEETLMAKHFNYEYYKNGQATSMLSEYLRSQPIYDFKDLLNIEAIYRPDNLDKESFMREYIERYPKAKKQRYYYDCLTSSLNEYLNSNYGVIIYQEDIIQIIREYTNWDYEKCNIYRKALSLRSISKDQLAELLEFTGQEVLDLLVKESPVVFCKAHSVGAWPKLIKKTAILKAKYKEIYYEEIERWELENNYSWGDFGFISGGVSLLQQ